VVGSFGLVLLGGFLLLFGIGVLAMPAATPSSGVANVQFAAAVLGGGLWLVLVGMRRLRSGGRG